MDSGKLPYFRKLLTERLDALLDEAAKSFNDIPPSEGSVGDFSDQAAVESNRGFVLRMKDRDRKLIVKIREALDRVEMGTYGMCEECGEEISEQRLKARPVTTLCIDCKTLQEEDERRRGE